VPISGQTASSITVPAPIGGLNTRDAVDLMPETDAIRLDNFFPGRSFVTVRKGFDSHVTGLPSDVETLMPYNSGTTNTLFAASGTAVYNVTSAGSVGSAVITSLNNAKFQFVNMTISGGSYLFICNEGTTDAPRHWNGSTWATPSFSGITAANIVSVQVFKERLFFVQNDSLTYGYLGTGAVAGSVSTVNLGSIFSKGGYLQNIGTWTRDGGSGPEDSILFYSSEGQLAMYSGTNPASADTWGLVGVYDVGRPIGRRCILQQGSDCYLITERGVVPMTSALSSGEAAPNLAITDKISGSYSTAVENFASVFGWQGIVYPKGGYALFNVPSSTSGDFDQYVINLETGAWARFTGQDSFCWAIFNGELYFGGNTKVFKADSGSDDDSTDIISSAKTAFIYYGGRDGPKRYTAIRPVMQSDANLNVTIGFDVDYADGTASISSSTGDAGAGSWDTAAWDVAAWSGSFTTTQTWQTVANIGWNAAIRIRTSTSAQSVRWMATDVRFEKGVGL